MEKRGKPMFETKRKIRLSETDATGVIYFTNILKYSVECFEEFLERKKIHLSQKEALPIVETKSQYLAPLRWGEEVCVSLTIHAIKNSSICLHYILQKEQNIVAKVEITHVLIDKQTSQAKEISEEYRRRLEEK